MPRKRNWGTLETRNRAPLITRVIPDDMHHKGMVPPHLVLCVDLYSWVGEEEGYDGFVVILSRHMQRCLATLQRDRGGDDEGWDKLWREPLLIHIFSKH